MIAAIVRAAWNLVRDIAAFISNKLNPNMKDSTGTNLGTALAQVVHIQKWKDRPMVDLRDTEVEAKEPQATIIKITHPATRVRRQGVDYPQ